MTSAHAQTTPLVLRCAVDAVIVNLCRASTARTTTSPERLLLPLLHTDAPQDRLDVAYRTPSSPCPFAHGIAVAMIDPSVTSAAPRDSINRASPFIL
jgi:hypothetical protein